VTPLIFLTRQSDSTKPSPFPVITIIHTLSIIVSNEQCL
jgi:hypothetical protein